MKFRIALELRASGPIGEARFDALADALYDLDDTDPDITDTDLGASLAEGNATVSMTVAADNLPAAATKVLCAARAAIHAIGDATPRWEAPDHGPMHIVPVDAADRLFADA
jgi:hypothetical protein